MSPARRGILHSPVLYLTTAVALVAAAVVAIVLWPSKGKSHSDKPLGPWQQVWRDDFSGPAGKSPDRSAWIMEKGYRYPGGGPDHWGTHEIQHYNDLPEDVSTDGQGHLRILPHLDVHGTWESSRIETVRNDFRPPDEGVLHVEARIMLPAINSQDGMGYWPAFWMLGAGIREDTSKWPSHGEFDILENVNGDQLVHGTLHCGTEQGGPCNEHNGLGKETSCPGSPCQGSFHVYAFEWDRHTTPEELRWYVDGTLYHRVRSSDMDSGTWDKATHGSMTIIFNVAMGGDFPDGVSHQKTPTPATRSGRPMVIDYVSVTSRS